jgi:predicted amidohydrolase
VLLRARAIECQAYVVAAAQAGRHNEKRESYGHSLVRPARPPAGYLGPLAK